ncbi:MAG: hypothetical protein H5U19_14250 [Rhodobacteraceae bacterium]|nr:hypothetical protein [Paracoccaceae bacterium]
MVEKTLYLLAYAIMLGFLGILFFKLPRVDLGLVILVTLVLAGRDLLRVEKK